MSPLRCVVQASLDLGGALRLKYLPLGPTLAGGRLFRCKVARRGEHGDDLCTPIPGTHQSPSTLYLRRTWHI
jgi:hypothetical protein